MISWNSFERLPSVMPLWQWGIVIVMFAFAIWMISRLGSYFREDAEDTDVQLEMLTQFRELHQQGGLSDDEFRLIRSRLTHAVQEASVTESVESKIPVDGLVEEPSAEVVQEVLRQSPDDHATMEELEKSGRMPDEEAKQGGNTELPLC